MLLELGESGEVDCDSEESKKETIVLFFLSLAFSNFLKKAL